MKNKFETLELMLKGGVKLITALTLLGISQEKYEQYQANKYIDIPEIFKEIFGDKNERNTKD